jgi:hypothetical protein
MSYTLLIHTDDDYLKSLTSSSLEKSKWASKAGIKSVADIFDRFIDEVETPYLIQLDTQAENGKITSEMYGEASVNLPKDVNLPSEYLCIDTLAQAFNLIRTTMLEERGIPEKHLKRYEMSVLKIQGNFIVADIEILE